MSASLAVRTDERIDERTGNAVAGWGSMDADSETSTLSASAPPAPPAAPLDLRALYDAHWHQLVRLAVLLVDDVASAEDVTQDAFVALHKHAGELRDPAAAVGYLRTTVLNLSRSVLRRRGVARKYLKVAEPEATAGADHDVLVRDEHRAALAAVRRLPRYQREVLVLRFWSGLSEREIAETLGISAGSVKSAASRGMATLSKELGSDGAARVGGKR